MATGRTPVGSGETTNETLNPTNSATETDASMRTIDFTLSDTV